MSQYPPKWADAPSDAMCTCGARAVIVYAGWGDGDTLACSESGFTCTVCPGVSPTLIADGPPVSPADQENQK